MSTDTLAFEGCGTPEEVELPRDMGHSVTEFGHGGLDEEAAVEDVERLVGIAREILSSGT